MASIPPVFFYVKHYFYFYLYLLTYLIYAGNLFYMEESMISNDEIKKKLEDRNVKVVAARIGVSRQTLYNWMAGKSELSLPTYRNLVEYLFPDGEK